MNRRRILAASGIALSTPLGGCLEETTDPGTTGTDDGIETGTDDAGDDGDDDAKRGDDDGEGDDGNGDGDGAGSDGENGREEYEECHLISIDAEWLPEDIREEVDAALEDGRYETERLLLADAVDPDRSYIVVDDAPYEPIVETENGTRTLELREGDVVRLPEPRLLTVSNTDDGEHEVQIELRGDETLLEETVTLEPGEERDLESTERFGSFELRAEALTGHEDADEFDFRVGDSYFDGLVEVTDDGVFATQSVAEVEPCPWDVRWE